MVQNDQHLKMFVADMLMDGMETLPSVLEMLNNRRFGGWRNAVTQDYSWDDVLLAITELVRLRWVTLWRYSRDLIEVNPDPTDLLRSTLQSSEWLWACLTAEGRQAVAAWEPPQRMDYALIEHLQSLSNPFIPLSAAYLWLNQFTGQHLQFTEYKDLISYMLEYDYIRLWQTQGWRQSQEKTLLGAVRLSLLPHDLDDTYTASNPADNQRGSNNYLLSLGAGSDPRPEREPLAAISDPSTMLEKLIEYYPNLRHWFTRSEKVRHIVIDERNGVTLGVGSVSKFRADKQWSKGLDWREDEKIRHIVLDNMGRIVGDYYGPIMLDPLDNKPQLEDEIR